MLLVQLYVTIVLFRLVRNVHSSEYTPPSTLHPTPLVCHLRPLYTSLQFTRASNHSAVSITPQFHKPRPYAVHYSVLLTEYIPISTRPFFNPLPNHRALCGNPAHRCIVYRRIPPCLPPRHPCGSARADPAQSPPRRAGTSRPHRAARHTVPSDRPWTARRHRRRHGAARRMLCAPPPTRTLCSLLSALCATRASLSRTHTRLPRAAITACPSRRVPLHAYIFVARERLPLRTRFQRM